MNMDVWQNKFSPEKGEFVVRYTDQEKKTIEDARRTFMKSNVRKMLTTDQGKEVKANLGRFSAANVFCYEDEHGVVQHEIIANRAMIADTRDVLEIHAGNQIVHSRKQSIINLGAQMLAGAVNILAEIEKEQPSASPEQAQALTLSS